MTKERNGLQMGGSGQQRDGIGVLMRLLRSNSVPAGSIGDGVLDYADHWRSLTVLSLCGCGFSVSIFFV